MARPQITKIYLPSQNVAITELPVHVETAYEASNRKYQRSRLQIPTLSLFFWGGGGGGRGGGGMQKMAPRRIGN